MALLQSFLLSLAVLAALPLGNGWLGVRLEESSDGPAISEVVPGSPAAKSDLRKGDVILTVDQKRVRDIDALFKLFEPLNAGDTVHLGLQRGETKLDKKVRLAQRPDADARQREQPLARRQPAAGTGKPYMGVEIEEIATGIVVARVVEGGPAAKARLQDGDLIRAIDGKEVRNFEQLEKVMSALRAEQQVTIEVLRAGKDRRHGLQLGSRPGAAPRAESERPRPVKNPEPSKPKPKPVAEPKRVVEGSKSAPIAAVPTQRFSTDYDGGMQQARRASRPVVVVFGASWCPNCATLKKALEHPSLQRALARYERIWVDTDRHSALADRYGVEDLPHLVLLDAKGEQRKTLIGYQPPQILLTHLQKGPATGGAAGPGNPAAKSDARAEKRAVAGQKAAARRAAAAKKAAAKKAAATNPAAPVAPRPERVARRAAAGAGAQQQARELARLRTEVQSLRREQRQQRELLQQILKELQQRK